MKKLLAIILAAVLALSFTACGGGESSSTEDNSEPTVVSAPEPDNNKTSGEFNQHQLFAGFNLYYREDDSVYSSDYGYDLITPGNSIVLIGCPGLAGVVLEANNLDEAITLSEKYMIRGLEIARKGYFDADSTELNIDTKEEVTVNGIKMCRVDGQLVNTFRDVSYNATGYYFLGSSKGNMPIYILGFEVPGSTDNVETYVDEFVSHITKN